MKTPQSLVKIEVPSPLGPIVLAASALGLRGLWFIDQRYAPNFTAWPDAPEHPLLQAAHRQLDAYFSGQTDRFDLPLDPSVGTRFQQAVWQALRQIPTGQTCSYQQLAQALGRPQAARATGAAVGRNPWSLVVPCHRVVGSDGRLTGYAGGLWRKEALLALESGDIASLRNACQSSPV
ncbi:methylated-DNA--[protein]-cysteine S-methyltransferase [Hydrogenophaga electricum]|uniref:Methylated-DNA--protein-cysteine methyltransferase n=1 Tax=Hydrogenophaga electricum TaxID=1230953 RepID=A0ABQ6C0Y5_9BURK|nr:methylated-DNA--[protein]-cysteine S-methyltransferase [Hydrogenophaga electricum]GLS13550.1 methylated-DNA--protein-cysteine methyltransferase [Hydrogenophaga electricum]